MKWLSLRWKLVAKSDQPRQLSFEVAFYSLAAKIRLSSTPFPSLLSFLPTLRLLKCVLLASTSYDTAPERKRNSRTLGSESAGAIELSISLAVLATRTMVFAGTHSASGNHTYENIWTNLCRANRQFATSEWAHEKMLDNAGDVEPFRFGIPHVW